MPRCPICRKACEQISYERVPIYNCGECGGHWLSKARLDVIINRREYEMPEAVQKKMIEIANASNTKKKLTCQSCGKEMVKERFKYWDDIQIDRCPKCDGIWLDRGELEKCQIYWEYLQDHSDEFDKSNAITRKALLDAELHTRRVELKREAEIAKMAGRSMSYGGAGHYGLARVLLSIFGR